MMDETQPAPSAWAIFCEHHSEPGNLALHLVGFVAFWGGLGLTVLHQDAIWLFAVILSGPVATLGHQLFEADVPAEAAPPGHPWVPRYVGRMIWCISTAQYPDNARIAQTGGPIRTAHPSLPMLIPGEEVH